MDLLPILEQSRRQYNLELSKGVESISEGARMRMKNLFKFAVVAVLSIAPIMAAAAEEKELLEAEQLFRQAKLQNDVNALGKILAEEYDGVNQWGARRDKASLMELFSGFKVDVISIVEPKVRMVGNMAVVDGTMRESGPGGDFPNLIFSRVWVKRAGRWQLLSSIQMTPMPRP
jgi:hypothetical protein